MPLRLAKGKWYAAVGEKRTILLTYSNNFDFQIDWTKGF